MEIAIDEEKVQVDIEDGRIVLVEGRTPTVKLNLDHATLMKLVLGLYSFGDMGLPQTCGLKPADCTLLETLFPRQAVATGNWG